MEIFFNDKFNDIFTTLLKRKNSSGSNKNVRAGQLIDGTITDITDEDLNGMNEILPYAFYCCKDLIHVDIPDNIIKIGYSAFESCENLPEIIIPDSVTEIGNNTFKNCSSLERVTLSSSMTTTARYVFENCKKLSDVVIPEGITALSEGTFRSCSNIVNMTLPSTITSMGYYAFLSAYVKNLYYNGDIASWCKVTGNDNSMPTTQAFYVKNSSGEYEIVEHLVIPDSVTSISSHAFEKCQSLKSVTMSDSVTNVDDYVFGSCKNLENVRLSNNLTSISGRMFTNCEKLKSITIPDSVTTIGSSAFFFCYGLADIVVPNSVTSIGWYAFSRCDNLKRIMIGNGITSIDASAFGSGDTRIVDIYIDAPEDSISGSPWGLTNATIHWNTPLPSNGLIYTLSSDGSAYSVSDIGTCTDTELVIPSNYNGLPVTEIAEYAFDYTSTITSVSIPNTVTTVGNCAFYLCMNLKTARFGNGITSISSNTFANCQILRNIYIDAPEGSISGSPWGAPNATVHWNTPLQNEEE